MKKILAAILSLMLLLCAAGCSGNGAQGDFTDVYSGAQAITKAQAKQIEALGKTVEGQKLVATADVSEFSAAFDGFEYMVYVFNADEKTHTVSTWRFCENEESYQRSINELAANTYLKVTEYKDDLILSYGTGEAREGGYDVVRSGLENDTLRNYIIVE